MPFLGQNLDRLLQNPGIQRMPTNQREWSSFVQELEKHLAGTSGTFTPTFHSDGFSSDPAGALVHWKKIGTIVMMAFYNASTGTSDNAGFQITNNPTITTPVGGVQFTVPIIGVIDSGVESWGVVTLNSSNDITFGFETSSAASWTTSGPKGWNTDGSQLPMIIYDTKFSLVS